MPDYISVADRLPDARQTVIVANLQDDVGLMYLGHLRDGALAWQLPGGLTEPITHWAAIDDAWLDVEDESLRDRETVIVRFFAGGTLGSHQERIGAGWYDEDAGTWSIHSMNYSGTISDLNVLGWMPFPEDGRLAA